MECFCLSSATRFLFLFLLFVCSQRVYAIEPVLALTKGFEAKPDSSIHSFQPLLTDPNGNFSFGFLRVNGSRLSLAVTHPNLTDPLWVFDPVRLASWSHKTILIFNGSLVVTDHSSRVEWSTHSNGDRLVLRNDSNLQVLRSSSSVEWESFDFPRNTLVENQNFTSTMALISSNGLYSMRLGSDFIGLYAKAAVGDSSEQFYWKHSALQAKAKIKDGSGPILARINPNGYLGMYQIGNTPIDVEAFNSFQRPVNGLLILRLESDGNLRGYLWDGSQWALNYEAIRETCDLPNPCGPYSLCTPGSGCSCIDNGTVIGECSHGGAADFCNGGDKFKVVRRGGVEMPFKELTDHKTTSSLLECEEMCVEDCKCFGSVYNNGSGFCYLVSYPIRTMLGVADPSKLGYFKIYEGVEKKKSRVGLTVGMSLLAVIAFGLTVAMVYVGFRVWSREKRDLEEDGGLSPGPYKNLGSDSFRSVEMSRR